jgi:hypothetical protein
MPLSQATLNALRQRQQSTAARTAQYSGRPATVGSMQSPTVRPPIGPAMGPQMGQNPMASPYPPYMGPKMPQQQMPQQQMQNPYQQQMAAQQALDQSKQKQMFNAMASPTYNGQLGMGNMAMPQMPQGSMDMPIRQDMSSMGMPPPPAGPAYGLRAGPMDMPQQAMGQQGPSMDMLRQALGNAPMPQQGLGGMAQQGLGSMPQQGLGGMAAGIGGIPAFGQQNFGMPPPMEQGGGFAQNQNQQPTTQNQQSPMINSTMSDTFTPNSGSPAFSQNAGTGLAALFGGLGKQPGMQGMQQMAAQPQQTPAFSGGLGGMQQAQPQQTPTFSQQGFFGQGSSGGSPGGGNAGLF